MRDSFARRAGKSTRPGRVANSSVDSEQSHLVHGAPAGTPAFLRRSVDGMSREGAGVSTAVIQSARAAIGERPAAGTERLAVPLGGEGGKSMERESQTLGEDLFGTDFSQVRVHTGPEAEMSAALLGARAFTQGNDVWLGTGARESDSVLMAHELAHVAEQADGVYLRSATWLERRAWLSFFDHYLPRKFLNNYMDDTGNPITLTVQEMTDINPRVDMTKSPGFVAELKALRTQLVSSATANNGQAFPQMKYIEVSGPGQAMTNGTLGNFTIRYKGTLTVSPDGTWSFIGTMTFHDYWDFDPKPFGGSGRSTAGEIKTRVAATALAGSPFSIDSVPAPIFQTGSDPRAIWAGGTPVFVNDRAGRAGSDIGAGGEVGGAGGDVVGPEAGGAGADVGGEVGAQSAEDLNR